jgi:hypothetical protein
MSSEEFTKHFDEGTLPQNNPICPVCKKPISGHPKPDPRRYIGDEEVHEDCYWNVFRKTVGQHPITYPGHHGRGIAMPDPD